MGERKVKAHLLYAKYVLRHKWFVFQAACKLGIPWLGIIHDWSKLLPSEWAAYVNFFYGKEAKARRDETGYYKPTDTGDSAFDFAWLLHQKRNKHHWQWWILPEDDGRFKALEMPVRYRKEMLADWRGAGRAQGKPDTLVWYVLNKHKMLLGYKTRFWIERQLNYGRVKRSLFKEGSDDA